MSYLGQIPIPLPPTPPRDTGPTITATDEQKILQQTLPVITLQQSFLERNKTALLLGSAVFVIAIIGMVLLVQI